VLKFTLWAVGCLYSKINWLCVYSLVSQWGPQCDNVPLLTTCTLRFVAAGSAKVEVNDQQIQTEIVETEHKNVQVGSTTKQQGVYTTVR